MGSIAKEPRLTCDLCGSSGEIAQTGVHDPDGQIAGEWSFRRCQHCDVFWLDPAPPPSELWKAYQTYHTHTRKHAGRLGKAMLSLFHRLIKTSLQPLWLWNGLKREANYLRCMTLAGEPTGELLDVGCGAGRLLNRMQKSGWAVEGVDFDAQAAALATNRYGIKTHVGDLSQCHLPSNSFDAITLSQTIEHLYAPKATLLECLRILKPGGLLVMTTPNPLSIGAMEFAASWRGWEAPRHLHLFSVATLKTLTEQSGFHVTESTTYSAGSAVVYRVSREIQLETKRSWIGQAGLLLWGYKKELLEFNAQKIHPHTGQNVLIRARKPTQ